jgi:type 1 glutamine amidotransferase
MQIQTLIDFVEAGGGLVAIEDASHSYDGDFPPASAPYIGLIGGDFNGHTGFGPGTCGTVGSHPTNTMLPATFAITDEVYYFKQAAPDIQVVLECENPGAAPRPVSWVRTQGAGRVFYTALGHADASWTAGPLVPDHVIPALLWSMGR